MSWGARSAPCARTASAPPPCSKPDDRVAGQQLQRGGGHQVEELLPGGLLIAEDAAHGARHQARLVRLDPPGGHAQVQPFDVGRRSPRVQARVEQLGQLVGEVLLHHTDSLDGGAALVSERGDGSESGCQGTKVALRCSGMALRKIVRFPSMTLRQATQAVAGVDDRVRALVNDMIETMYAADGAGLAAIQVGASERIFIDGSSKPMLMPSPLLTSTAYACAVSIMQGSGWTQAQTLSLYNPLFIELRKQCGITEAEMNGVLSVLKP